MIQMVSPMPMRTKLRQVAANVVLSPGGKPVIRCLHRNIKGAELRHLHGA